MSAASNGIRGRRAALWFGLLGGAIAWTLHLVFAYVAAEFGCVAGLGEHHYLGITLVAWLAAALTLATFIASGAATLVAYRCYDRIGAVEADTNSAAAAERHIAWAGVLTSGLFAIIILFESIPILYYLRIC